MNNPKLSRLVRWGVFLWLCGFSLISAKHWILSYSSEPPTGCTGAPGDSCQSVSAGSCMVCHTNATLTNNSSDLSLSGLTTYRPEQDYAFTLTLSNDAGGNNGLELTTLRTSDNSHTNAGSLKSPGTNTAVAGDYWRHNAANTATSFSVTWTAPAGGSGVIRFYGAVNKGGAAPSGNIHLKSWDIYELPNITSLSLNAATTGQTLTITGTAFGAIASTVSFNGTYASYTSWSSTSITAIVPQSATSGDITIINSTGTSNGKSFTVLNSSSAPLTPTLIPVALSTSSIKWQWDAQSNVSTFSVISSTGPNALSILSGSTTYWIEINLSPGTAYSRYVRAANDAGSADSSTKTAATADAATAVSNSAASTISASSDPLTTVSLPAGALGGDGTVLISLDPTTRPLAISTSSINTANNSLSSSQKLVSSTLREFLAYVNGEIKTSDFNLEATLSIPYPDADADGYVDGVTPALRAGRLSIYRLNESSLRWEALTGNSINLSAKTISAPINHFSVYAIVGAPASSSLSPILVFPNPFRPGSGSSQDATGLTFRNLTTQATIRIFSINGELVRTLEKTSSEGDQKLWDAKNETGQNAASGVYFYSVQNSDGEIQTGKLAIIR